MIIKAQILHCTFLTVLFYTRCEKRSVNPGETCNWGMKLYPLPQTEPFPLSLTVTDHWAGLTERCSVPGRDLSTGPRCQHLLSQNTLWKWLKSSLGARLSLWEIQLSCALAEVQMEEKTEKAAVQKEEGRGLAMKGRKVSSSASNLSVRDITNCRRFRHEETLNRT